MINLLYSNPWRPLDAWWQRARGILDSADLRATFLRDGPGCSWIKRALRFQLALEDVTSDRRRLQLIAEFPHIYRAHSIYTAASADDLLVRFGIESRILARQTNEDIAAIYGCTASDIEAYESLFFNVRERLVARNFILLCVVNTTELGNRKAEQDGQLWKLFGYLGGPHVLESMILGFPDATWPKRPEDVSNFLVKLSIRTQEQGAAIAGLLLPENDAAVCRTRNLFAKHLARERSDKADRITADGIRDELLRELKVCRDADPRLLEEPAFIDDRVTKG